MRNKYLLGATMQIYGLSPDVLESLIDRIAYRYRKYVDKYCDDWVFQRDEAIADVVTEYKNE